VCAEEEAAESVNSSALHMSSTSEAKRKQQRAAERAASGHWLLWPAALMAPTAYLR